MKRTVPALALAVALFFLLGAGNSGRLSGLRGNVLLAPPSPQCQPGMSCSRPAAHVVLKFWHGGLPAGHTRTDGRGRFRIALRPRTYAVTVGNRAVLRPAHVTVATDRYRRVTFRIDTGIR